jgi:hypothetical protein
MSDMRQYPIIWHAERQPPEDERERLEKVIYEELGERTPINLVFHLHIPDDITMPFVIICGGKDDNAFHCKYIHDPYNYCDATEKGW